jgi:WhiB family redox-sensing transcriptional regulator
MARTKAPIPRHQTTIIHVEDPLCSQTDPEMFFPSDTVRDGYTTSRFAKEICSKCDYTMQCLVTALMNKEEYGIWGGATVRERKSIRSKAQAVAFVQKLKSQHRD